MALTRPWRTCRHYSIPLSGRRPPGLPKPVYKRNEEKGNKEWNNHPTYTIVRTNMSHNRLVCSMATFQRIRRTGKVQLHWLVIKPMPMQVIPGRNPIKWEEKEMMKQRTMKGSNCFRVLRTSAPDSIHLLPWPIGTPSVKPIKHISGGFTVFRRLSAVTCVVETSPLSQENLRCNRKQHILSMLPLGYGCFLWIMTAYPVLSQLEWSYKNVMRLLPYVISNYSMMQISHTACIRSTPFFQSSSPPPQSPSPPSPWPPSQSPPSGIVLFDYSSTKCCKTLLPAKPNPPLPACSQQSHFNPYQRSQIHRYQLAPSGARSTANGLLWAKPDCQRWERAFHHYQRSQIVRGESEHSTATSLLPPKPHCQRGESDHIRAVRPSISEVAKWICQSCVSEQITGESEHVRVGVGASMSVCTHVRVVYE